MALFMSLVANAQSPKLIKYQSIIRNSEGVIIAEQAIGLKISILASEDESDVEYTEVHYVTTNKYGLVNLNIGGGDATFGNFDAISWGTSEHFISVSLDMNGGNDYEYLGTTQLLSVPYALYAETSGDSIWSRGTSGEIYYTKGRVGVGTDNPQKAIHVRRVTDKYGNGINQAQILIESADDSDATLYLAYYDDNDYNPSDANFWRVSALKENGDFAIEDETDNVAGGNGAVSRLLIKKSTGYVGVGIDNPQRQLHIANAIRLESLEVAPKSPSLGDIYSSSEGYLFYYNGAQWDTLNIDEGINYLSKNTDGHLYYTEGRIGIGTNNPQKALHIRRMVDENGEGIGQAQALIEAGADSDATLYLGYYPDNTYTASEAKLWRVSAVKENGDFAIEDETDNVAGGDGAESRLLIKKSTGNVGIGISNPQRKLHISDAMRLEPLDNAPLNPVIGDMYFGTDGKLHLYNGTAWYSVDMTLD